jgi:hypothetical protein
MCKIASNSSGMEMLLSINPPHVFAATLAAGKFASAQRFHFVLGISQD